MPPEQQLTLDFDSHDTPSTPEPEASHRPPVTHVAQASEPVHRLHTHIRKARGLAFRTCDAGQLPLFRTPPRTAEPTIHDQEHIVPAPPAPPTSGEKAKARDILAAVRILKQLDAENRPASPDERRALARFGGFGAIALSFFPDPVTGTYKDHGWQELGEELESLLSPVGSVVPRWT